MRKMYLKPISESVTLSGSPCQMDGMFSPITNPPGIGGKEQTNPGGEDNVDG